jgi:Toprim domain
MTIGLDTIDQLTGGRLGTHDVPCPACGPYKTPQGQRKRKLRVWRTEPTFATYHCVRCDESGFAFDRHSTPPDPIELAKARAEATARDRALRADRLSRALRLWSQRRPIADSVAETYLREIRGYGGPLPATLGFLPPRGEHPPAMIAAFGVAHEVEPGIIAIRDRAITGVHLTRLRADGLGKAVFDDPDENAKIMVGFSAGSPIVLASPNDLLGLAVTEGVEDGLSIYGSTGLGVWAAGAGSRMPALSAVVPAYIESVLISADDDPTGRRGAFELVGRLGARGIQARAVIAGNSLGVAA